MSRMSRKRWVHEVLEGSGAIGESERHHAVFVEAVSCPEGRLPFFPRGDPEEVVGSSKVDLAVNGC